MTKTEFNKLEPFNEEKFKNGEKVVALYGGEPTYPQSQKYYEGHPEPIVLTVDGEDFAYNAAYAKNTIRMVRKERYVPRLEYMEGLAPGVLWTVYDTQDKYTIASFLKASEAAKEFAEEYAQFLNDVEQVLEERTAALYPSPYTITTTEVPISSSWQPYFPSFYAAEQKQDVPYLNYTI